MTKSDVLKLFGGSVTGAADGLGITHSAVSQWPDTGPLPEKVQQRVQAYLFRRLPAKDQRKAVELAKQS